MMEELPWLVMGLVGGVVAADVAPRGAGLLAVAAVMVAVGYLILIASA